MQPTVCVSTLHGMSLISVTRRWEEVLEMVGNSGQTMAPTRVASSAAYPITARAQGNTKHKSYLDLHTPLKGPRTTNS